VDEAGELSVDLVVDLPHALLGDERVGAVGAELPAVEVGRVPRDELGELRLPVLVRGVQETREVGVGNGAGPFHAGERALRFGGTLLGSKVLRD